MNPAPQRSVRNILRIMASATSRAFNSAGLILDSIPFPVTVVDRRGNVISFNKLWREPVWQTGVLGAISIGLGANYLEILHRAAAAGYLQADDAQRGIRSVCDGSMPSYVLDYFAPDGNRWLSMTVMPLQSRQGGAVITHRDISDLKRTQAGLRESEQKFQRIADKAPTMLWMVGADKRCIYCNNQWLDFTGRKLDRELETGWIDDVHPDHRDMFESAFGEAFEKRKSFRLEYRLRSANGEFRWVSNTGLPGYKDNGEFIGFIGSCIDISDRRATEEMLLDLGGRLINAQEEERSRIARELHDNLSQDMALLSIEIEQLTQLPPNSEAAVNAGLHKVLHRVQGVSSEMHRMSYELHPSKLDRLGLAAATLSLCKELSSQQSLHVNCDFTNVPDSLPHDIALCIYRVVQESLQNIVKHSGAYDAVVELHGFPGEIRLRITDKGVGFNPELTKRKQGLGLLSMQERLRLVGGTMSIESQPLRGTQIDAVIPLREAHPESKGLSEPGDIPKIPQMHAPGSVLDAGHRRKF
jgi:PAS domain S-box-containing protein